MLNELFERAHEAGVTQPALVSRRRLADNAAYLSAAGDLQARLDVCISAMASLIKVLYTTDADDCLMYVDVTDRIMIPVPWGSSGWRRWGLRKWEAEMLRAVLIGRYRQRKGVLFGYDRNQWYLDTERYPTMNDALLWLKSSGPTLREWRAVVEPYRERNQVRMSASRELNYTGAG
jgi:hypothetical protein